MICIACVTAPCWPLAWLAPSAAQTGGAATGRSAAGFRAPAHHHSPKQDRPGRRRSRHRHSRGSAAVSQGAARSLDRTHRHHRRAVVSPPIGWRVVTAALMPNRAVARLVQMRAAGGGYDAAAFAGHSLRVGFLTAAAAAAAVRSGTNMFKCAKCRGTKNPWRCSPTMSVTPTYSATMRGGVTVTTLMR